MKKSKSIPESNNQETSENEMEIDENNDKSVIFSPNSAYPSLRLIE